MGKFSLICQAARLLGQVLDIVSRSPSDSPDESFHQLDRTLQAMLAACLSLPNPDFDQMTLVYSALAELHTPGLSASSKPSIKHRNLADQFMKQLISRINANLVESQCLATRDSEDMPPWGLFFAYRVCVILATRSSTASKSDSRQVLHALKESLGRIEERWCAAGKCTEPVPFGDECFCPVGSLTRALLQVSTCGCWKLRRSCLRGEVAFSHHAGRRLQRRTKSRNDKLVIFLSLSWGSYAFAA